jgi:hypothetical protein
MTDYSRHDPKGWCGDPTRGAALGRPTVKDAPRDYAGKLYIRRVYLNSGGYDSNGTYFGTGAPLFWVSANDESPDVDVDFMLRAASRDAAIVKVRAEYPNAKIRGSRVVES